MDQFASPESLDDLLEIPMLESACLTGVAATTFYGVTGISGAITTYMHNIGAHDTGGMTTLVAGMAMGIGTYFGAKSINAIRRKYFNKDEEKAEATNGDLFLYGILTMGVGGVVAPVSAAYFIPLFYEASTGLGMFFSGITATTAALGATSGFLTVETIHDLYQQREKRIGAQK